jgi:hypothetical protein
MQDFGDRVPSFGRSDRLGHAFPARAVVIEVAVLKLHPCPAGGLRNEPDLYLTRLLGVGLDAPLEVDIPRERDPLRRVVRQHPGPTALAAVDPDVVDVAAHPGLDDHFGQLALQDVMVGRPP